MSRSFHLALIVLAFACIGGAWTVRALDFQLSSSTVEEDGFKHEQSFFHHDDKTDVLISLPAGWDRAAEPASLTLTSPTETDALIRLEKSPFAPDLAFKDKGLDTYRRRVLAAVPQGATETQIAEEHDEPLPIFRWKDYEFVVDYVFFGRAFRRSVVFVDLDAQEQIMVTTAAPKAGYDRIHSVALDVLRSWQVMPKQ